MELCGGVATASLWCLSGTPPCFWGSARYFVSLAQPPEKAFERFGRSYYTLGDEDRDLAVRLALQARADRGSAIRADDQRQLAELAQEVSFEGAGVGQDLAAAERLLAEIGLVWRKDSTIP